MVGEIRDRETAQIAVEAALTGHLVLSTLHTNDAADARSRASSTWASSRSSSPARSTASSPSASRGRSASTARSPRRSPSRCCATHGFLALDVEAFEPVGCARCGGTGYKGRARPLRGHDDHRRDPRARRRPRVRRRDRRGRASARACAACARTASRRSSSGAPRSPRSPASRERSSPRPLGCARRDVAPEPRLARRPAARRERPAR